jgi:hypothetical protein
MVLYGLTLGSRTTNAAFHPRASSLKLKLKLKQRLPFFWRSSSVQAAATDLDATTPKPPVPMTLLAGFLGTGKTTTLQHLLQHPPPGVKIGVVVNDVASVNIDAKLLGSGDSAAGGVIELQNGCACCSIADELFVSIEQLVQDRELDAIVVECKLNGDVVVAVVCVRPVGGWWVGGWRLLYPYAPCITVTPLTRLFSPSWSFPLRP